MALPIVLHTAAAPTGTFHQDQVTSATRCHPGPFQAADEDGPGLFSCRALTSPSAFQSPFLSK